ncbi:MAG: RsbRD N-terminal domain-containing protein [Pseudomonadota bacterium]
MLEDLQREKRAEIVDAWIRAALMVYSAEAATFYENGKDPFANPVGASVRDALGPLFDAFVADAPVQEYAPHLDRIIRVRCVQDVPASQAVGFVFLLRGILRKTLASQREDARALAELMALDARIDRMAACAFDVYAAYVRKIADLKVREMKASVATLMRMSKITGGGIDGVDEKQGRLRDPVLSEQEAGDT